jgi:alpha-L-arabinofuranosidase
MARQRSIHKQWARHNRAIPRLEALEDRAMPSTVFWISSSSGSWTTAANWSSGAVPGAGDDVVINQSAAVKVTLPASTSINSLSLTGATLNVTGGTLAVAADSSNAGSLQVQPGAHVSFAGNYSQNAAGSLTLPAAGLTTGVGNNLLKNTGLQSPSLTTTAPSGWASWGTSYLSTQYAHTGAQSLEEYGPASGVEQSFAAAPGVSYTGTVYAMTPATNPLTGPEGGFLQVIFYDASGNWIGPLVPPNSVNILNSTSASGGPISGSVGTQGWNYFSTTAVAPSNAATVYFMLQTGAYTGLSGTAGGAVYFDDPQFGLTAAGGGIGTNLLTNTGMESPSLTTTAPTGWTSWGTPYLSTQYAHTGAQSLEASGPNSGVGQYSAATPGVAYTGTVYAMTPAGNQLTGPEGAFLQVTYWDASGNQISSYSPPNSLTILDSTSATGGPIPGSVGSQGWNYFSTTTVAPANAAWVGFVLETGAYTGLPGTPGGAVFWADPQFGPTAANAATVNAVNITNNGTMTIGAGDTVGASGTFTQTSTLDIQLGGPPASGLYGSLSAAGAATLGGTLEAALVNGYSPAVNDGFNAVTYAGVTGTFAAYQLPSGSRYTFAPAVNPTYVGLGAVPTQPATTINAGTVLGPVATNMLGVNLGWWDDKLTTPQTRQMVQAAGLTAFRFPGGSSSDDYHFNISSNFGDAAANTIPQFAQFIEGIGGTGLVTLDYGSGSPQEAAAELAYLEGSTTDTTVIGTGLEWIDSANQWQSVNWQTVGYWASLRAATPLAQDDGYNFLRINHPAAFSEIKYWEVGNEEYGSWEIDHHGTPGPGGVSTGAQHDPATYAAFAHTFAGFAAEIDRSIRIGIDSDDPTGADNNNWTKNVLTQGQALGFVPGFISDHCYMQAPGQESDATLLLHTVSDPKSVLDWSTRYADYQSLLQATVGSQASSIQVMATEFNSVYANPGKQSTSLVNGLFIADAIGSLLDSGYTGGFVWALRGGWDSNQNNSPSLFGWRQGGDYGILGDPNTSTPPSTGPYVPYPSYFAEQLTSKIVQAGGQVVSASSNYQDLTAYAVLEANGHLELLVINKDPDANLNEQFTVQGFTPNGRAQLWQYGEAQDYAQSQTTDGSAALANSTATLTLNGSTFNYTFPAYSMTVLDLAPVTTATATLTGPSDGYHGVDGQTRTFAPGATDSSSFAQQAGFTYTINWGDGTIANPDVQTIPATAGNGSGLTVNHVFLSAGTFTVSLTATDVNGNASLPVTLGVNILSVEQQGNTLAVGGGSGKDAYTFTPGASNGTITVSDNSTSLGTFSTTLAQVYGGAGTNTVSVSAAPGGHSFTINSTSVTVRGVSISGAGIGSWTVNGTGTGNTFAINGSGLAATLNGGTGNDTFTIAAGVVFDGTINGSGTDTLVNKSNSGSSNSWLLTGTNAGTVNGAPFTGIANLTGGVGNDRFAFQPGAILTGRINGNGGTDTLDWSAYGSPVTVNLASKTATAIGGYSNIAGLMGSSAATTLIGPNAAETWAITGADAGMVGSYSFTSFANLVGGTGVQVFKLNPAGSVLSINGGGPGDWLDYSLLTTAVLVDLTRGSATGVNGGAAGSITNIANVRGGNGNDTLTGNGGNILLGGGGTNALTDAYSGTAAGGRSLLIGGSGPSTLTSGSAGDILIGGTAYYDSNNTALAAILAEWQSADDYNTRFNRLEGVQSGGLNGPYHLLWGSTVTANKYSDTLVGSTVGLDWFFAQLSGKTADVIDNLNVPGHEHLDNTL